MAGLVLQILDDSIVDQMGEGILERRCEGPIELLWGDLVALHVRS